MKVSAAILAGGRARRMGGQDKSLLEIDGVPILQHQLEVLHRLFDDVMVVVGNQRPDPRLLGPARLITDRHAGQGPLSGMDAAFAASRADALLVLACDLPFLDENLIKLLCAYAPRAQAVVPRILGQAQPLHARYARSVGARVQARLARGELRLLELVEELQVAWLDEPELRVVDPKLRGFTNVNTPEDLQAARSAGKSP
jgi:molybdopterin-guanine dinucleotide biosynthesis protein A